MTRSLSAFNQFMSDKASGRAVLLLLAIAVVSFVIMAFVITPAFQEVTGGLRPFDLNFGIGAELIYRDLPFYTDRSRSIYLWFAFVDFVYPAAAAAFFALLWAWLFKRAPNRFFAQLTGMGVLLIPFLFALVDWLENIGFLIVIFRYPAEHVAIADLAGALKTTKPLIEFVVVIATLAFVVISIMQRRRRVQSTAPPD